MNKYVKTFLIITTLGINSSLFTMSKSFSENSLKDLFDEKTINEIYKLPKLGKDLPGYLIIGKDGIFYLIYNNNGEIRIEKTSK
jgi:hypothetical protein